MLDIAPLDATVVQATEATASRAVLLAPEPRVPTVSIMESRQLSRQGRESYRRHEWTEAFAAFSRADGEAPLAAEDLERLATTAHLVGRDAECAEAWARAHQEYLRTAAGALLAGMRRAGIPARSYRPQAARRR